MVEAAVIPATWEGDSAKSDVGSRSPRAVILETATQLFGERGYNGASMRDIAKAVGILPGSLYAHISSKEAILLEIIESGVDRFLGAVERIDAMDVAPDERLRLAVREHLLIVAENPQRTHIVFHQWRFLGEDHRVRVLAKRAAYAEFYMRTLRAGMQTGIFSPDIEPKVAVFSVLGALNWTPEWLSANGPATPVQLADRIMENILHGLSGRRN
jgi:AcrR family transcriptional regulator